MQNSEKKNKKLSKKKKNGSLMIPKKQTSLTWCHYYELFLLLLPLAHHFPSLDSLPEQQWKRHPSHVQQ